MHRIASLVSLLAVSITAATCAKKPPTIGGPPPPPKPPPFVAAAAPEPISTPGVWFAFDPDFIRARYRSADLAFGSFTVSDEWRVSLKHGETCSGEDAEVHVGSYEDHLGLADTEVPFSSPVDGERIAWGTVIEPPNVTAAERSELKKLEGTSTTFDGYLRVWNEGHFEHEKDRNPDGSSNPNHVLELHPAWRMTAPKGVTRTYSLQAMDEYSGYGLSKLKTILGGFASRTWPTMYQDADTLYVHLPKGQPYQSNFFQLPVVIRSVTASVSGSATVT